MPRKTSEVFILVAFLFIYRVGLTRVEARTMDDILTVEWKGRPAQIEVGGPFVGVEFHGSSYLPARMSFFYPMANSIDLSGDYWKRHLSKVMALGLQIGDGPRRWLGASPVPYRVTPSSVLFEETNAERSVSVEYRFCHTKPAALVNLKVTNMGPEPQLFLLFSHLDLAIRTSSSYIVRDKASTVYDTSRKTIFANYDDLDTGQVALFVANVGTPHDSFSTSASAIGKPMNDQSWWMQNTPSLDGALLSKKAPGRPAAAFTYRRLLQPGETMSVIQLIGSCKQPESSELIDHLQTHYKEEVLAYERKIASAASAGARLKTGDSFIDHATVWARAVLEANQHYLDGEMVPMPCPAEYNFFFSHDILLTSLSALHFDPTWVGANIERIGRWSKADGTIPHARYFKDGKVETEYAGSDNWNNLWFVIVTARYYRHSGDRSLTTKLLPCLRKSLATILTRKKNGLIWAFRPDWWDIGTKYGPRAYMTILTIRALREMANLLTALDGPAEERARYDALANELNEGLINTLWDEKLNYLISTFEDGTKDEHYYIGSLLAPHFSLLDHGKARALVDSAQRHLVDDRLGVYNAVPMDFHELGDFFSFHGDEAGDVFTYMNGGMWSQGLSWYVLALTAVDRRQAAFDFLRRTMTVKGIMESPNGQPAMFEYRIGDDRCPKRYGKVDKPQFLWAAGWYLYSWYHVLLTRETASGTIFVPFLPTGLEEIQGALVMGGRELTVHVSGKGRYVSQLTYDKVSYPSTMIPQRLPRGTNVEIVLGIPHRPYLASTTGLLISANADKEALTVEVKSYPGHDTVTEFISMRKPQAITINGKLFDDWQAKREGVALRVIVRHQQREILDTILLRF